MTRPWWLLESLRTGRLLGLETHRFGTLLPDGETTNAVAAQLARAGRCSPTGRAGGGAG